MLANARVADVIHALQVGARDLLGGYKSMLLPRVFVSYRRTESDAIDRVAEALQLAGVDVFVDRTSIEALASFPEKVRDAIADCHIVLVWWTLRYAESEFCMQELLLAWQYARRADPSASQRIWIVNPEPDASHIVAGELGEVSFLSAPSDQGLAEWASEIASRARALSFKQPLGKAGLSSSAVERSGVPLTRQNFTGRTRELWLLHSHLHPPRIYGSVPSPKAHIFGLGGIGKTETAASYAERFGVSFPGGVFWLNFARRELTVWSTEMADVAWLEAMESAIRHHRWTNTDPPSLILRGSDGAFLSLQSIRQQIQDLLESSPSLWILDGVPEIRPLDVREEVISRWDGPSPYAKTILVSRDSEELAGYAQLALGPLEQTEGQKLLARYSAPETASELDSLIELVNEVGGHPLALTLIGERARDNRYCGLLKELRTIGMAASLNAASLKLAPLLGARATSIAACFAASVQSVPAYAQQVLRLVSCLHADQPVSRDLLAAIVNFVPECLPDGVDLGQALRSLLGASLLSEAYGRDRPCIHPLLADWVNATTSDEVERRRLNEICVFALVDRMSSAEANVIRDQMSADLSHAIHLLNQKPTAGHLQLVQCTYRFELALGFIEAARMTADVAASLADSGPAHSSREILTRNLLADAAVRRADMEEAVTFLSTLVECYQKTCGDTHRETCMAELRLSDALHESKRSEDAMLLLRATLKKCRSTFGARDEMTLRCMHTLSKVSEACGNSSRAYYLQVIAVRHAEAAYGDYHPITLRFLNRLTHFLPHPGSDNDDSARILQEIVVACQTALGLDHPTTLEAMSRLAWHYDDLHEINSAGPIWCEVINACRRKWGYWDLLSLFYMNRYASSLLRAGRSEEGEELLEEVIAVSAAHYGVDADITKRALVNLAVARFAGYLNEEALVSFDWPIVLV